MNKMGGLATGLFMVMAIVLLAGGAGAGAIEQWNRTFGGTNYDYAYSVQQTSDGGYILAGETRSYGAGTTHAWLIKTDTNGNQQWNKTFGGTNPELARSVQQTSDGGYILAGVTRSFGAGYDDAWLIKTDANGNQQWNKTFGGTNDDGAYSVQQTSDGSYILAGGTRSYGVGNGDAWLIKVSGEANTTGTVHNINKGANYTTIQAAINDASTGDEIRVDSGMYYENVNVNKRLILRGIEMPVVDAMGNGSAITISADGIVLEGFIVTNATRWSDAGIEIWSNNNTITGNNASGSNYGIDLSYSGNNNTLKDNQMSGNRYNFNGWGGGRHNIDTSNLVDGKPIYYLVGASGNVIDPSSNAGTVYCVGCENITVKDLTLTNNSNGIYFHNTNGSIIENNTITNNVGGIYLFFSGNDTIKNNTLESTEIAMYLHSSSNNTVAGNNASNNPGGGGMLLSDSSANNVTGNTVSDNTVGIHLDSSTDNLITGNRASNNSDSGIVLFFYNYNNTIADNYLINNKRGISLHYSNNNTVKSNNASSNDEGIELSYSEGNNITGNKFNNNVFDGIFLWFSSTGNTITGNHVSDNRYYGIRLYSPDSDNNTIYNNYFNNTNNAWINGNNTWNTTRMAGTNIIGGPYLGGNFWAHPNNTGFSQTCPEGDGDGICDSHYVLDGNNTDYLPLAYKSAAQDTTPPASIMYLQNISYADTYINWTWTDPPDLDFSEVMIYIDGIFKKNASKGVQFYTIGNLASGTEYKIGTHTVDISGNINQTWVNDTAWTAPIINVSPFPAMTAPPTDPDLDGTYEDINGNGRKDFNDVVLFFNNLEWIPGNEPLNAFDFNGNGGIDFADIVRLFEEV